MAIFVRRRATGRIALKDGLARHHSLPEALNVRSLLTKNLSNSTMQINDLSEETAWKEL
jgi:hypothetical protein